MGLLLYDQAPDSTVAQNAYAYYFITRSDPSRSWDKETIFETTTWRTNVWKFAGTPITPGMEKAGAGPSQELVDSYEMIDGTQPILGYSDSDHLHPIINKESSYDPKEPYKNRDPRFMPPFIIMDPFVIWIILMVIRLKHLLEVIVVFQIM